MTCSVNNTIAFLRYNIGNFYLHISKGRLQTRRLPLFRTIETGPNRMEPPVNRRLGFEAVPKSKSVSDSKLESATKKSSVSDV